MSQKKRKSSKDQIKYQFEELANGIVLQAAQDYRTALRQLRVNPAYEQAIWMKEECERFFQSRWFSFLTLVDGDRLINRLRKEIEEKTR